MHCIWQNEVVNVLQISFKGKCLIIVVVLVILYCFETNYFLSLWYLGSFKLCQWGFGVFVAKLELISHLLPVFTVTFERLLPVFTVNFEHLLPVFTVNFEQLDAWWNWTINLQNKMSALEGFHFRKVSILGKVSKKWDEKKEKLVSGVYYGKKLSLWSSVLFTVFALEMREREACRKQTVSNVSVFLIRICALEYDQLMQVSRTVSWLFANTVMSKHNSFQQKHGCLNLATEKQEQRLCACFHLFIVELE